MEVELKQNVDNMPGFIFNSALRPYQAPVDLGTLERTYNKLEEGHQQTIGLATAYKTQLASLDLNAEEDAWRQQKIAQIDNAIANNITYGNAYTAMDDVMKEIGDIASDPGMIGRIRAQKQYEEWEDNLDKSNLPQDYKNYFKKKNQYYYEDKYDENGNIIGGTDWKPQKDWVDPIDYNAVALQALQIAAKEQGGGTAHYFIDKEGNRTTDMTKATGAMYIDTVTGQWTKLSEDKIKEAYRGLINNNPAYRAAIQQDWEIANDVYKTDKVDKYGIIGPNGYTMSKEEWIESKIDPIASAAAYYNYASSSSLKEGIGASLFKAQATANAQLAAQQRTAKNYDPTIYHTDPLKFENPAPAQLTAQKTSNEAFIKKYLPNYDFSKFDYISAVKQIDSLDIDPVEKNKAKEALMLYEEANTFLNQQREKLSSEMQDVFDTKNAIESGSPITGDGYYAKQWKDYVESYFDDNTESIGINYDSDKLNAYIEQYPGGRAALEAQGLKFEYNGNKARVILPASNKNNMWSLIQLANGIDESFGTGLARNITTIIPESEYIFRSLGMNNGLMFSRDYDGNEKDINSLSNQYETTIIGQMAPPNTSIGGVANWFDMSREYLLNANYTKFASKAFELPNVLYNQISKQYHDGVETSTITTSGEVTPGPNIVWDYYNQLFLSSGDTEWKNRADAELKNAITAIQLVGTSQYDVYSYGANDIKGNYSRLNSTERQELGEAINSGEYDIDKIAFTNGTLNGQPITYVTIPAVSKFLGKNEPIKFAIRNFGNNRFIQDYMSQPAQIASDIIKSCTDSQVDIPITNNSIRFDDIFRFSITPVSHENYILNNLTTGEQEPINKYDAFALKEATIEIQKQMEAIKDYYKMTRTISDVNVKELDKALVVFCKITKTGENATKRTLFKNYGLIR